MVTDDLLDSEDLQPFFGLGLWGLEFLVILAAQTVLSNVLGFLLLYFCLSVIVA